jgi:hypothetical protein
MKASDIAKRVSSMPASYRSLGARGFAKAHSKKIGMGAAGIAAGRSVIGGRRSGLDKTRGRPTGMYNY